MKIKITRVNGYRDGRFGQPALDQHGAFLLGETPCQFVIVSASSAVLTAKRPLLKRETDCLIGEFRFYSEHITNFYDAGMKKIKSFPKVALFDIALSDIQPSQFYVDEDKVKALAKFFSSPRDIVIPMSKIKGKTISLDGHTRLFIAASKSFEKVTGFYTKHGDYIDFFVESCLERGVRSPYDLISMPHEQYTVKWDKFCDDFFERTEK